MPPRVVRCKMPGKNHMIYIKKKKKGSFCCFSFGVSFPVREKLAKITD